MRINSRRARNLLTTSFAPFLLLGCLQSAIAQNTFPTSGNAGAGGASPLTPLEVYGPVISTFTGNTRGALSIGVSGSPTDLYYRAIDFNYSDSYGPAARIAMKYDSAVGSYLYFGTSNNTVAGVTNSALVIDPNGRVGVGTTSPGSILTVQTTGTDTAGEKYVRIKSTNSYSGLLFDPGQAGDAGWLMMGGYPNAGDFTIREYGVGNYFTIKKTTGNVGIGTASPTAKLHVYGSGNMAGIVQSTTAGAELDVISSATNYGSWGMGTGWAGAGVRSLYLYDNVASAARLMIDASGNVGIGTTTPSATLHVQGTGRFTGSLTVDGNINAKYQDVAEWVPSSHALVAGTVVTLDPTKSNHVEASSRAYDTRVAGVVSAQPGITLGEQSDSKVLVATTGRVKVMVDASSGPIAVGDLLVTSDISGVAKKSEPLLLGGVPIHRPGTLIGKALEPLAKGRGEILVLLSLQ